MGHLKQCFLIKNLSNGILCYVTGLIFVVFGFNIFVGSHKVLLDISVDTQLGKCKKYQMREFQSQKLFSFRPKICMQVVSITNY